MENIVRIMLSTKVKNIPSCVDALAFYDDESNRIAVISVKDYKKHNYSNYTVISKTAELSACCSVKLMNLNAFISKNPSSGIENYISAAHSDRVLYNFDFYVTAYIILYRNYKSLETLTENNFISFIDTFIDNCVESKNDHPGSICYFNYQIHKVLKIRKAVFAMFKDYINNYSNYMYIYNNQHEYKYTDKQFRVLFKTLEAFSKCNANVKRRLLESLEVFSS